MIINDNLFNDLLIESHRPLAIQSLKTLNNLDNFIIIKYANNVGFEIIPIREFNYLQYKTVVITISDEFDATFFMSYIFANPPKTVCYIIINNQLEMCSSFDVRDKVRYINEDKVYLELLVNLIN